MRKDAANPAHVRAFIREKLPLAPLVTVPEIRLHKAQPSSGLYTLAREDREFGTPYWAYEWAGGLALARYLLDHPAVVAGRRVLDLGAGSGLVAIAAARVGAARVLAAEIDPYARIAMELNVEANGVAVSTIDVDLAGREMPPADLILAGDLFYDADLTDQVATFLGRCRPAGIEALVGDPWRPSLPTDRLRLLATYSVVEGKGASRPGGVFAFTG